MMSEKEILDGLPIIIKNAKLLYKDALLLEKSNRKGSVYSLYQLSLEEIAKAFMLLEAILFKDISDSDVQRKLKKEISNHPTKLKKSIGIDIFLSSIMKSINEEKYKEWSLRLTKEYEDINMMNNRKNYGFYVSFKGTKFQCPDELIKKKDIEKIKNKAGTRIYFGSKIINAMIPNFPKIKAQAQKINYSEIDKENIDEISNIIKGSIEN